MRIGVISLLPGMFHALNYGVTGRAIDKGLVDMAYFNPRDDADNAQRSVDDRPYGGGPGMVMQAPPLAGSLGRAKQWLSDATTQVIYMSPRGKALTQQAVNELAGTSSLIFVAGRYEGVDERFIQCHVDHMWSLGDYVISGGELAIMVVVDAIVRQLPGGLGDCASAQQDSFMQGLLDHPHYTRPPVYNGLPVPAVLTEGNHAHIARWRRQQALGYTWQRRPDLLDKLDLSQTDEVLLADFKAAQQE